MLRILVTVKAPYPIPRVVPLRNAQRGHHIDKGSGAICAASRIGLPVTVQFCGLNLDLLSEGDRDTLRSALLRRCSCSNTRYTKPIDEEGWVRNRVASESVEVSKAM